MLEENLRPFDQVMQGVGCALEELSQGIDPHPMRNRREGGGPRDFDLDLQSKEESEEHTRLEYEASGSSTFLSRSRPISMFLDSLKGSTRGNTKAHASISLEEFIDKALAYEENILQQMREATEATLKQTQAVETNGGKPLRSSQFLLKPNRGVSRPILRIFMTILEYLELSIVKGI
eukprot:Gb_03833 [translate_table: standard]